MVTTQQGDDKGNKDGAGKHTKYICLACGTGRAPKHAEGFVGFLMLPSGADWGLDQVLPWQGKG